MQATGIIVEYNPFHLGHRYHAEQARKQTEADCIIAVMSGPFLQRGEPAIIDKWERSRSALLGGVDLVVELPHLFAVQHGDYFSKGAVETLAHLNVSSVCFGSEEGTIAPFHRAYRLWETNKEKFDSILTSHLTTGLSYPEASKRAYEHIGLTELDVSRPNNILGYSYVKAISLYAPSLKASTIQRIGNDYHEEQLSGIISSATSIRKSIHHNQDLTDDTKESLPDSTVHALVDYKESRGLWHSWEDYFPLIDYLLATTPLENLREIHGMDEGLEYRLVKASAESASFQELMENIKTKRYTWTRLQRLFVHILTGTKKSVASRLDSPPPYVRILGMNKRGRQYLSEQKKKVDVPLVTQLKQTDHPLLDGDIRAQKAYLFPLSSGKRKEGFFREKMPPILLET